MIKSNRSYNNDSGVLVQRRWFGFRPRGYVDFSI